MMYGKLSTDLEEYEAIQKNINYKRMLIRKDMINDFQVYQERSFEDATNLTFGKKQDRKTLFSTIIENQTSLVKKHNRKSVI